MPKAEEKKAETPARTMDEMMKNTITDTGRDPIAGLAPDLKLFLAEKLDKVPKGKRDAALAAVREDFKTGPKAEVTEGWHRRIEAAIKSATDGS